MLLTKSVNDGKISSHEAIGFNFPLVGRLQGAANKIIDSRVFALNLFKGVAVEQLADAGIGQETNIEMISSPLSIQDTASECLQPHRNLESHCASAFCSSPLVSKTFTATAAPIHIP
eukprot:4126692-Amphidinium_carterae.1